MRFEHVSFTYPGATEPAVRDVSFQLKPGGSLALVGENGSGKTTLIKLLTRLYVPTSGRITLDGLDLAEWNPAALRRRIGVIFQDFARYQLMVGENIGAGDVAHFEDERRWHEAASLGMAAPFVEDMPGGYHTQLGKWFKDGRELSGGQWQKIALSRAFMREDADILVLDEPTASMDARAEAQVFEQFRDLARDRMVILISHRFSTVRMADQILVIQDGRILEQRQPRGADAPERPLRAALPAAGARLSLRLLNTASIHQHPVAGAGLRLQVTRAGRIAFDLLAQAMHQLLQQLAVAAAATAPDVREQALGADDVARVRDQDLHQARLELRELQRRRVADAQLVRLEVEAERAPRVAAPPASSPARRSSALTRASSVRGLNGFVR